jgi:DNA helicase-2/ATP-dependent DNA helicase PcrA
MVRRVFDTRWDEGLDEAQLAAATYGDAPLIVVAGAGTGKTRTLVARVAALLDRGVEPERILLLTFTRRAAEEMLHRAAVACGRRDVATRLWGGTFHAVAYRLVAEYSEALGLGPGLSVLDPADAADLMDLLRQEYGQADGAGDGKARVTRRFPRGETLVDIYSRAVNTGVPAREVIASVAPWCAPHTDAILELFTGYVARKRERGLLDFDDLLLSWRALLSDPTLGPAIASRWSHVLVDEYQDVNQIQVDIVRLLCPDGTGLTVVGDDAQAIYGFRGADSRHLIALRDELPTARTICLEQNFRSRQRILDLANVVRPDGGGPRLRLRSTREGGPRPRLVRCPDAATEARLVTDAVLDALDQGRPLRTQAVLMRAAHHSDLLEVELTSRGVPYVKYGGLKFLEAAHVKDFIAGVRLLDNPRDELAWFRLLRLHDGIGPSRARAVLDALRITEDGVEARHPEAVAVAPAGSRTALAATLAGLAAARGRTGVAERAEGVLELLRPLLTARYPDHPVRLEDLDRLVGAAAGSPSLAEYVASLTLDPPASTSDVADAPHRDEDWLTLSTVHSAKGLEWDTVHVIHAVDGAFPSDMALGSAAGLIEERRLFYVAVTRARNDLVIYTPLRMPHHRRGLDDRHSYAPTSRFLDEPALATLDIQEHRRPAPAPAAVPSDAPATATPRVTLPSLGELFT